MRQTIRLTESELRNIISESVKMVLNETSMESFEKRSQPITVELPDGTRLTFRNTRQYKKWKESQQEKKVKKGGKKSPLKINTGEELDPNQLHSKIQKLIKSAAPLDSLFTFKQHAYRSYGNVANEIMQPFAEEYRQFSIAYRKIDDNLKKIAKYGKADDYEAYSEARKLTYNIEDMQIALVNLCNAVKARRKEIKMKYGNMYVYNGRADKQNPTVKKELGFVDQLFSKSAKAISTTIGDLQSAAEEIADIADKGRNPLSYEI